MRTIKFRAWKYRSGKMYQVTNMSLKDEYIGVNGVDSIGINYINADKEEDEFALMQYTGLKDKNGKEIYEGDIVASMDGILEVVFVSKISDNGYYYSAFEFKHPTRGKWGGIGGLEVIGNIYENPELLAPPTKD